MYTASKYLVMVEMVILSTVASVQSDIHSAVQWLSSIGMCEEGALYIPGGVICMSCFFFHSLGSSKFA